MNIEIVDVCTLHNCSMSFAAIIVSTGKKKHSNNAVKQIFVYKCLHKNHRVCEMHVVGIVGNILCTTICNNTAHCDKIHVVIQLRHHFESASTKVVPFTS